MMQDVIRYRPHRGGLAEAMAEARVFNTEEDMKAYVFHQWNEWLIDQREPMFTVDDIVIGEVLGDDSRIGWKNVRHVCVKRMGSHVFEHPQCIGWCGE